MPAGTIALNYNSNNVSGSGTSFTKEIKAGDFIGVTVGGAPYTIVVLSINSDTQLTMSVPFNGPSSSGLAWYAVPASFIHAIPQQALNDMGRIARGMLLEKSNWQGIYSDAASVTVTRPDMSTYTGPSWGYLASQYAKKVDKSELKALAKMDAVDYDHVNNELQRNTFATHGRSGQGAGVYGFSNTPFGYSQYGINMQVNNRDDTSGAAGNGIWQHYLSLGTDGNIAYVTNIHGEYSARKLYSTSNTSVSSNGVIMAASPIVRIVNNKESNTRQDLHGTGNDFRREYQWISEYGLVNDEAEGCTISKKGTGTYIVTGAKSLAKDLWYVMDCGNGQGRIIALSEAEETAEGIEVRCYKQKFTLSEDGDLTVKKGELIDIPDNTWIDIRLEMPDDSIYNEKIRQGGGEGGR